MPEAFVQAIHGKHTVQDLIGVLFALRLLDYEARGRSEPQWQTDEGFCLSPITQNQPWAIGSKPATRVGLFILSQS